MMSYLGEVAINSIYVIESIPDGEFKSGKSIYEDLKHLEYKFDYLSLHYNTVADFSDLKRIISSIHRKSEHGEFPLIHFETYHGSKSHFVTKNGSYVEWGDLLKLIQPINIELNLKLLISIGACYSAYFLSHMYRLIKEPAPCLASIGSSKEVAAGLLASQYTLFYKTLIETNSISEAHKELKNRYPDSDERLLFIHAPKMFKDGFKQAYKDRYSIENFDETIQRLKEKIKKDPNSVNNIFRNKPDKVIEEHLIITSSLQKALSPKQYAEKFFMCDLYPENYKKFDVEKIIEEMKQLDE